MNEFRICDKCRGTNMESLVPKLKEIDSDAKIVIGCQNMCGIGRTKAFAILNHIPVIANNEEELLRTIKERIKK